MVIKRLVTRFEGVPEEFVERYDVEFRIWAREFRRWGRHCKFILRGRTVGVPVVDEHGGEPMVIVELEADMCGGVVVIRPADIVSADLIERHVAAMREGLGCH